MITLYIIISTIITGLLSMMWTSKNWLDIMAKTILVSSTLFGLFLITIQLGYIVKQ